VLHTDIRKSSLKGTAIYDITKSAPSSYISAFDVVINISTVEEVGYDHVQIYKNLLEQVKPGGLLILTFDLPGLQLNSLEEELGRSLEIPENVLTGQNSKVPNMHYYHLQCGILTIKK
jgi:hypothetical protein